MLRLTHALLTIAFVVAASNGAMAAPKAKPAPTDLECAACVSQGELDFDPATQAELDAHGIDAGAQRAAIQSQVDALRDDVVALQVAPLPGSRLVVVDATGNQVGEFVSVWSDDSFGAMVLAGIGGRIVLLTIASTRIPASGTVAFEGPDCTGNAWINSTSNNHLNTFVSATIARARVIKLNGIRELWAFDDVPPGDAWILSWFNTGSCSTYNSLELRPGMVPATLLDADLDTLFPPPYSIEYQ